jgi:hypothetical protein
MEDNDPHKRMRRFGELCGYFYGRRFFGLETIMSDRDSDHMLLELQEARAEIDRLRKAIANHREAMKEYHGSIYDFELWDTIGPLPGGE